jgi:hypothetical protein
MGISMKIILKALLAAVISVGSTSYSAAQDGSVVGDFAGLYIGSYFRNNFNGGDGIDIAVGGFSGFNVMTSNALVFGIEAEAEYDWNSEWGKNVVNGMASVRAGGTFGDDQKILLYIKGGAGYSSALTGIATWHAGGGGDLRLGDRYMVRMEFDRTVPIKKTTGLAARWDTKAGAGVLF